MKIGILSYYFPPEPAFIPGSLAEELAARGHEVRVLTGFPDYPGGRVYPGWRQRWHHETHSERLTVRRVPRYPGGDGSSLAGRYAGYLSFAGSAALTGPRYLTGIDALYVYHLPATMFAAAGLLRLLRRVPTVLHVQDVWPDGVDLDRGLWRTRLDRTIRQIYDAARAVAVIAPSMREHVIAEGADPAKVRVVLNWTDERIFQPVRPSDAACRLVRRDDRCVVMHAGTIGPRQHLETAVRAAAAVNGKTDLVLVGSGPEEDRLRRLAAELSAANVRFEARRSPVEMPDLYAAADYQLVSLADRPVLRGAVPATLPAAFACAAPVVASAAGDTVDLVERARAGLSCPPGDWSTLADRFWLAATIPAGARREMGQRGRESYLRRMSMQAGVDQIQRLLYEVATGRAGPR
ncbi:glycosyltransferase family 4 protein [Micromonospora sp. CPCC 206060]|uniref:glycosyltransferase family 4 protein n=1 Tax=Micromonospora sp. CPCC 206060 TaxID=3122406 RepID=UPI002FF2DA2B